MMMTTLHFKNGLLLPTSRTFLIGKITHFRSIIWSLWWCGTLLLNHLVMMSIIWQDILIQNTTITGFNQSSNSLLKTMGQNLVICKVVKNYFIILTSLDMGEETSPPHFQNSSKRNISHRFRVIRAEGLKILGPKVFRLFLPYFGY